METSARSGLATARILAAVLCASTWCSTVRAEDAAAGAAAHFERGYALARGGDYEQAIDEFKLAYDASPNFSVLFNLGQAYGASGRPVEAQRTLQRYLEVGGSGVDPEQRRRALELIDYYGRRIGRIDVTGLPPGAVLSLDGEELATAPIQAPIEASVGRHAISIHAQGYEPLVRAVDVKAGQPVLLELTLRAHAVPVSAGARVTEPSCASQLDAARYRHAKMQTIASVAVGVGAVLLGGASATLAIVNHSRYREWRKKEEAFTSAFVTDRASVSTAQLETLLTEENSIRNRDGVALGLGAAAGTLALTSIVLYLTAGRSAPVISVRPHAESSLSYRGVF